MKYFASLLLVAALTSSCTGGGESDSESRTQRPPAADWAIASEGSEGGVTWRLESKRDGSDRICIRLRFEPSGRSGVDENCQTLEAGEHVLVLTQANEPFGHIYGIAGATVTEVRATLDRGSESARVTGQAFMLVTSDAFAVKSIGAYAGSKRLEVIECLDGGC